MMLSAEERAKELVKKFSPLVYPYIGSSMLTNDEDDGVILMMSKKCAVIAVEHSIERVKEMHLLHYEKIVDFKATEAHSNELKFLKEILVEIDKVKLEVAPIN